MARQSRRMTAGGTFGSRLVATLLLVAASSPCSGWQWACETVDSAGTVGTYASLAVDTAGFSHVSYQDPGTGHLRYAWQDSAGWHVEVVTDQGGQGTALALSSDGTPHIGFIHGFWARHACRGPAGWEVETIPGGAATNSFVSLQIDAKNTPHMAFAFEFYGAETGNRGIILQYAVRSDTGWRVETADEGWGGCGIFCSLAVDSQNRPHISHADYVSSALRYCHKEMDGWHYEVLDQDSYWSSLVVDAEGLPHIAYVKDDAVIYGRRPPTGWEFQTAFFHPEIVTPCLRLDSSGNPHISVSPVDESALWYAFRDGSFWWVESVVSDGEEGWQNSLALDQKGLPRIAYAEGNAALACAWLLPSSDLSGFLAGPLVYLTWTPVPGAAEYWVYGADGAAFFDPGVTSPFDHRLTVLPQGTMAWLSPHQTGSSELGWAYLIVATTPAGQEICRSGRVGEISFLSELP